MSFSIGQRVQCIKRGPWLGIKSRQPQNDRVKPKFGRIYTIRAIEHLDGFTLLRFEEIVNPVAQYTNGFMECGFLSTRFRPLNERKTDISALKKLENPVNHRHLEEA